ncbi:tetratricopeptide repeat-containing sensor histidine kinase [Dyadobacter sp. CY312]|uniref:tetratricopeptide repeat-containing sensor histidine kinase n=1 Tax=Dyadobacter sp. CY312 TaxID=2907303 RepID=UPI001F19C94F|nr:tetratricopeptide repeat-containing sensor histidine kinase [Dyadobacter sp. CY312]MCE7042032.1 tetratricopeptide repeat-containing sensor histidine kinase [Dyadobacter sp. CY312]
MKILFPIFLVLLFVTSSFSQKQGKDLIDSLVKEMPHVQNDSLKVRLLKRISDEYFFVDVDQALKYSRIGLKQATKINWQRAIGAFNLNLGRAYGDKGQYDSCMHFYRKVYQIYKSTDDKVNMASVLNNMGAAEQNLKSDYTKAAGYYFEALKIGEALKDDNLIALAYDNISHIYFAQSNYPKALEFGFKCLKLRKKQAESQSENSLRDVGNALSNIAGIYTDMNQPGNAKVYYNNAVPMLEKSGDLEGLAKAYSNLSILSGKDFDAKLYYALKAETLWNEVNPRHLLAVHNVGSLGIAFREMAQNDSIRVQGYSGKQLASLAKTYLTKAIALSKQTGEISSRSHFTGALAEIQAETGDYKNAYHNFRAYQRVQDSLYSQESKNKIAGLEGKRELELRDKQIKINKLEIDVQKKQRLFLIAGIVLVAVIGGLLFWQNQSRKRTNIQLLHLNAELDEANKIKARFFAILSHDLRSPVSNLINFLHLQKEAPELMSGGIAESHQKRITESAELLLENMESMLLWSKGQMQNFKPQVRSIEVSGLFEYIQKFFAGTSNVTFSFSNPESLTVVTDEDYLKTIMQNLTANAVKALRKTPEATILWEAKRNEKGIVLSIIDNGPGASEQQLSALRNEGEAIGIKTGMGLHIVRDLAKAISCQIVVRSDREFGMEFQLRFADV